MKFEGRPIPKGVLIFTWVLIVSVRSFSAMAQPPDIDERLEIASSPNPVGSGARALGMGGAFIAVADDATAASWNPGGLIQVEFPEVSCVFSSFHRMEHNCFENNQEASFTQTVSAADINYLSAAYPFSLWERNMIVSINYQNLYDFTRKWDFPISYETGGAMIDQTVDLRQEGQLSAIGLAWCARLTKKLSFGLTLNMWDNGLTRNEWEQSVWIRGSGEDDGERFTFQTESCHKYALSGWNVNFGFLWRPNPDITLGGVLKTPLEGDLEHTNTYATRIHYPDLPSFDRKNEYAYVEDETIDMPMSYGLGIAYQPRRDVTLAFDIYRTEWDDFVIRDENGVERSPVTGLYSSETKVDPTHQIRAGFEYLHITPTFIIPLCAGVFYDPAPSEGSPDDIFGCSVGSGIGIGRFHMDLAYQYRFGRDVGSTMMRAWNFSQDVEEHTVYCSTVVHF